jgi:hypothetical protein
VIGPTQTEIVSWVLAILVACVLTLVLLYGYG